MYSRFILAISKQLFAVVCILLWNECVLRHACIIRSHIKCGTIYVFDRFQATTAVAGSKRCSQIFGPDILQTNILVGAGVQCKVWA